MAITGRVGERYEIVSVLGSGAMGEVYRAVDRKMFDRTVAIKFLAERLTASDEGRARFRREVETVARLEHPNIVTIHDWGEHQGRDFFVMEYVDGRDLHGLLVDGISWGIEERLELAYQLTDALAFAHRAGVVHRDIKPGNIMVILAASGPRAKLVDFGIVRLEHSHLTQTSHPGTLSYMSPEQLRGEAADRRSDLFSLGIVLYELFSKRHPFQAASEPLISSRILGQPPHPLGDAAAALPPGLDSLILGMLEKDPTRRPGDAGEVGARLRDISRAMVARSLAGDSAPSALDDLERHMVERLVAWAEQKEAAGAVEDALAAYEKAARLAPASDSIQEKISVLGRRVEATRELERAVQEVEHHLEAERGAQARQALDRVRDLASADPRIESLQARIVELESITPEVRERRDFIAAKMSEADAALDAGKIDAAVPRLSEILRKYPDQKDVALMLDRLVEVAVRRVPYTDYRAALREARAHLDRGALEAAEAAGDRARSLWADGPEIQALQPDLDRAREEARRRAEESLAEERKQREERARRERAVLERYLEEARALLEQARSIEPVSAGETRRAIDTFAKASKVLELLLLEQPGHSTAQGLKKHIRSEVAELEQGLAEQVASARTRQVPAATTVGTEPVAAAAPEERQARPTPPPLEREPPPTAPGRRLWVLATLGLLVVGLGAVGLFSLRSRPPDPLDEQLRQVLLLPEGSLEETDHKLQQVQAVASLLPPDERERRQDLEGQITRLDDLSGLYQLLNRLEREQDSADGARVAQQLGELFDTLRSKLPAEDPTAIGIEKRFREIRGRIESRGDASDQPLTGTKKNSPPS